MKVNPATPVFLNLHLSQRKQPEKEKKNAVYESFEQTLKKKMHEQKRVEKEEHHFDSTV